MLSFSNNVNVSELVNQTIQGVEANVLGLVGSVEDYWENYTHHVLSDWEHGDFSFDDLELPTLDYDFDWDNMSATPNASLQFTFNGLELYMLVDTILSAEATYTLNVYTSKSEAGIRLSDKMELGVTFTVDLILDAKADIDLQSGFHIKFADGLAIDIALFGKDVSGLTSYV